MSTTAHLPAPAGAVADQDLDWVMTGFARRVPGIMHAIAVTADGLFLASTPGLDEAARRQLCAVTSGIASLSGSLADLLHQRSVKHALVEMDRGLLIVAQISDGSALAVLASHRIDLGMVGYEIQMLVSRVGQVLTPALRAELTARAVR